MEIIETLNGVRIVRSIEGRYGIQEKSEDGSWDVAAPFRYSMLDGVCKKTARAMSAENDRIDAYEAANR